MLSNKQSMEEVLNQKVVKTTIPTLYDRGLFDKYGNADEVLKHFVFAERRRRDLEELNDDDNDLQ